MMGMTNVQVLEFNKGVIADFREHGGVMPEGSRFHGNPTLLLTMTGAKSGRTLTSPLTYATDGDHWIIMASAAGSEQLPAWGHNLRANPDVTVEMLGDAFDAVTTECQGPDRDSAYGVMTSQFPRFADYQANVERTIPLFRLTRK
jgi:deazaflavin-dependent oxidoreductase (nitroreductase family)